MRDYVGELLQYCHDVVNDTLANRKSCNLEKLACQRHLDDLLKSKLDDWPYYFNEEYATQRCYFSECLQHVKGIWAGQNIHLEPHQIFMQASMFGWLKKKNNLRRFYSVYFQAPRKQGKSMEIATTGLWMGFADGENGAEVYSLAQTEAQSLMTFAPAYSMVKNNPQMAEYFDLKLTGTSRNPTSIYRESDMSKFMPVIGKPGDGSSPHLAIIDEFHEAGTDEGRAAMQTGGASRSQPMIVIVTTAGVNTSFPCYDVYLNCKKILQGTIIDDTTFTLIYEPDEDDDWQDFEVWKKVNVNYGVSIDKDYLWGRYQDALNKPGERNILLTKHLNIWQNAGIGAFDMLRWGKCADTNLSLEQFRGQECWLGIDLASKIDLAALVFLFRYKRKVINEACPQCYGKAKVVDGVNVCVSGVKVGEGEEQKACSWSKPVERDCVAAFARHYIPFETADKKENQHYRKWAEEGYLTITEGARTDFQAIEDDIREISKHFAVKELTFDPKEASYLIQNIEKWSSFECIEFEQGPATISQPMKELEAMIVASEFWHSGDPCYTWCVGNVVKKKARSGGSVKHYFPTKENDNLKIDSAVATICALGRYMTYEKEQGGAYESRVGNGDESILRTV